MRYHYIPPRRRRWTKPLAASVTLVCFIAIGMMLAY